MKPPQTLLGDSGSFRDQLLDLGLRGIGHLCGFELSDFRHDLLRTADAVVPPLRCVVRQQVVEHIEEI